MTLQGIFWGGAVTFCDRVFRQRWQRRQVHQILEVGPRKTSSSGSVAIGRDSNISAVRRNTSARESRMSISVNLERHRVIVSQSFINKFKTYLFLFVESIVSAGGETVRDKEVPVG